LPCLVTHQNRYLLALTYSYLFLHHGGQKCNRGITGCMSVGKIASHIVVQKVIGFGIEKKLWH